MKKYLILAAALVVSQVARAELVTADLFELKSNFGKKLFHMDAEVKKDGEKTLNSSSYTDLEGKVALTEKAVLNGEELVSYELDQKQTGQKAVIEVKEGVVYFSIEKDGKKKEESEKLRKPLLVSANLLPFVKNHWAELITEKGLDVRYAVWDRMDTVGFRLFKVGEKAVDGKKWIQLRMKPSSSLIAALVDPIEFWFDEDSKHLQEMVGRSLPLQKDGSKFKELDCEVRYNYPAEAPAATPTATPAAAAKKKAKTKK